MPSASGVYSLPVGYLAVTGATIQASQHNPPLEDIASALTARLSRDGTAPMTGPLQLASGTVAAPGEAFASDPSSGFYKTTAGIGVAVAGVKVAEFVAGGILGARFIGELIPFTGIATPVLTVQPFGQTLSRTTYAALWAVAQIAIAAGHTFYNNGDGSTTFGVGDCRGRVLAALDAMGGTAANRLTTASVNGAVLGSVGGLESATLTNSNQLPTIVSSNGAQTITVNAGGQIPVTGAASLFGQIQVNNAGAGAFIVPTTNTGWTPFTSFSTNNSISTTFTNASPQGHSNVQPTLVCNLLLFAGA